MIITFGLHVGRWHGPGAAPRLGHPVLGRPAFLGLLETHLGLTAPAVSAAARTAAYLVALRAAEGPDRFFHRSLQADEIGTAAQLLQWRDEWVLGGWDGKGLTGWPSRLADLAVVEAHAAGKLPGGEGDRLAAVLRRLQERGTPIEQVVLLDPFGAFPARWQDVLLRLREQGAAFDPGAPTGPMPAPAAQPQAQGDLAILQAGCYGAAHGGILPPVGALAGDGTVTVLRARSCEVAEHWLADRCRSQPLALRLIVSEEHGPSIDDTLRGQGLPACGFDEASALRPGLQALPLALETLWDPIEPQRLLDFLAHPINPLRAGARRMLARAFAERPGIGGPAWAEARENLAKQSPERAKETLEAIAWWLESPRWDRQQGAPIVAVMERVQRLRERCGAAVALHAEQNNSEALVAWRAALEHCGATLEALQVLEREGGKELRARALQQVLARAAGSGGGSAAAQVGCMSSASTPAACGVEAADEVIWWMPAQPKLPKPLPWVGAELQALAAAGVRLRDPAREMGLMMTQWVRPLLAARHRLVLVLPPEGSEEHPAWQLISTLWPRLAVQRIEDALNAGSAQAVAAQPLPPPQGNWKLDHKAAWRAAYPVPSRQPAQSYTSLDVLFNHPALTVLRDAAALRAGATWAVQVDNRLLGNLSHRLVEKLFGHDDALRWSNAEFTAWFPAACADVLQREGMPLLAPGCALQLQQFKATACDAITALLALLRAAGAHKVHAERSFSAHLGPIPLNGQTDLLIELADGAVAALDLKWARSKRYLEELAAGDFVQLALYAHLVEQCTGKAPVAVGYFTFRDAILATASPGVFPGARVVTPANGMNVPQLLEMVKTSWAWRVEQWQAGDVEVVLDASAMPAPPAGCLPRRDPTFKHRDHQVLLGNWEDA